MKLFHSLALIFSMFHVGQVAANRTNNRGEVTVPPAPNGVVTIYASKTCRSCYRMHAEVKGRTDWDFRFVYDRSKHPVYVDSVPYIVWRGADGRRYFVAGWEDFETWEAAWQRTQR